MRTRMPEGPWFPWRNSISRANSSKGLLNSAWMNLLTPRVSSGTRSPTLDHLTTSVTLRPLIRRVGTL